MDVFSNTSVLGQLSGADQSSSSWNIMFDVLPIIFLSLYPPPSRVIFAYIYVLTYLLTYLYILTYTYIYLYVSTYMYINMSYNI